MNGMKAERTILVKNGMDEVRLDNGLAIGRHVHLGQRQILGIPHLRHQGKDYQRHAFSLLDVVIVRLIGAQGHNGLSRKSMHQNIWHGRSKERHGFLFVRKC